MNLSRPLAGFALALFVCSVYGAESAPQTLSAKDLAARLSAPRENGTSHVRLRMQVQQPPGTPQITLQIQIKERRTKALTEVVYQVLWPKERKGEAVLLRQAAGRAPSGSHFVPTGQLRTLKPSEMSESLFGSDLALADAIENFFAWKNQTLVGTEPVDGVRCAILESKPGSGDSSIYGRVRTWVDPRRLVPLRIEKYLLSGQLARRIETTRVALDGSDHIPANLTVQGPRKNSITELDGSRIRHDIPFADREFTPEGLKEVTTTRTTAE